MDEAGKTVATAESPVAEVGADGKQSFSATVKLAHPAMWSPEEPNLYYSIATVESGGDTRDRDQVMFGVRTVEFDPDKGFFLNGKSTPIQGLVTIRTTRAWARHCRMLCTRSALECSRRWDAMLYVHRTTCLRLNGWRLARGRGC